MKEKRRIESEELKKIQLDILKEVDSFCRQNNIQYYLAYGTLLGAVRHGGYIPWDDDIDIVMPRPDYERFKKEFYNSNNDYEIRDHEIDSNFLYSTGKIEYKNSELKENVQNPSKLGVNIDVFVLDGIKANDQRVRNKLFCWNSLYNLKQVSPKKDRAAWKNIILVLGQILLKLVPLQFIVKRIIYISKAACEYDKTNYICPLVLPLKRKNPIYEKEWFCPIELYFEGEKFYAPQNYDAILTCLYGDYMKLPPIDEQVTHHDFKAYVIE